MTRQRFGRISPRSQRRRLPALATMLNDPPGGPLPALASTARFTRPALLHYAPWTGAASAAFGTPTRRSADHERTEIFPGSEPRERSPGQRRQDTSPWRSSTASAPFGRGSRDLTRTSMKSLSSGAGLSFMKGSDLTSAGGKTRRCCLRPGRPNRTALPPGFQRTPEPGFQPLFKTWRNRGVKAKIYAETGGLSTPIGSGRVNLRPGGLRPKKP